MHVIIEKKWWQDKDKHSLTQKLQTVPGALVTFHSICGLAQAVMRPSLKGMEANPAMLRVLPVSHLQARVAVP